MAANKQKSCFSLWVNMYGMQEVATMAVSFAYSKKMISVTTPQVNINHLAMINIQHK
jgi:hypothetical protein